MAGQDVYSFGRRPEPYHKRSVLYNGYLCEAVCISRTVYYEETQKVASGSQTTYREPFSDDWDVDTPVSSHSHPFDSLSPSDALPEGIIHVRDGPYDDVLFVRSSTPFVEVYEELCEAMAQLSLEDGEGGCCPDSPVDDEILEALNKLSFETHEVDEGDTTLVEWGEWDSETVFADDESCATICIDEEDRPRCKPMLERKLPELEEIWELVCEREAVARTFDPSWVPPQLSGPWILSTMGKVGLGCRVDSGPPSCIELFAPVFRTL